MINYFSRCISTISIVLNCVERVSIERARREVSGGEEGSIIWLEFLFQLCPVTEPNCIFFYQETIEFDIHSFVWLIHFFLMIIFYSQIIYK